MPVAVTMTVTMAIHGGDWGWAYNVSASPPAASGSLALFALAVLFFFTFFPSHAAQNTLSWPYLNRNGARGSREDQQGVRHLHFFALGHFCTRFLSGARSADFIYWVVFLLFYHVGVDVRLDDKNDRQQKKLEKKAKKAASKVSNAKWRDLDLLLFIPRPHCLSFIMRSQTQSIVNANEEHHKLTLFLHVFVDSDWNPAKPGAQPPD
jgi:hypothetical protein